MVRVARATYDLQLFLKFQLSPTPRDAGSIREKRHEHRQGRFR